MDEYIGNDQLGPVFTLLTGGVSILEVPQLKVELAKRGLITSGTKSVLNRVKMSKGMEIAGYTHYAMPSMMARKIKSLPYLIYWKYWPYKNSLHIGGLMMS